MQGIKLLADNSPKNAFWQLYCLAHREKSRCTFRTSKNSDNSLNGHPKARGGELCFPHGRESNPGCWASPEESRLGLRLAWVSALVLRGVQRGLYQLGKLSPHVSMPEISRVGVQAAGVQTLLTPGTASPQLQQSPHPSVQH